MQHKVLLVSANRRQNKSLGSDLGRLGFGVMTATRPAEALKICREAAPPLVLMDAGLLEDAAGNLIFSLKRDCPASEVIILCDESGLPLALDLLNLYAGDVITLPYEPVELQESLASALDRIRLRQKLSALRRKCQGKSGPAGDGKPSAPLKDKVDWLASLERTQVAVQTVEALRDCLDFISGRIENGKELFGHLPCFISLHNQERKVVALNQRGRQTFGNRLGSESWELCSSQKPGPDHCPVNQTFVQKTAQFSQEVVSGLADEEVPVLLRTAPILDSQGQVALVMTVAADMREIKKGKGRLFAMRRQYQQLFDEAPCFISVQDRDLKLTAANRMFKRAFGDEINRPCYQVLKGYEEPCHNCPVKKTFIFGEPQSSQETLRGRDGTAYEVLTHTAPIRDAMGQISHVMEMSLDITETRNLQRQLDDARRLYQQLFDEVPCYISVQDRNFKLTATNRRFKEDFGEEVGAHCYEIYKHRTQVCNDCPVAATFADGRPHSTEEVVTSIRGENIYTLTWTAPLKNEQGEITHVMEMSTDITQIRQMQDHLTSLGLLIGSMSHGVKGLLTGLDGGMYLMNTGFEKGDHERVAEGWKTVKLMVDRIKSTVMDILYYSKERDLNWECAEAVTLAERAADSVQAKAESHGIEFVRRFQADAGSFKVDSSVLASALVNLLENAVDACVEAGAERDHRIVFSLEAQGDLVVFDIHDNGVGMDDETRNNIFTLFFSSKGSSGTGLGLYIANRVIEQHGGSITVDSTVGQGTHFQVRIPKQPPGQIRLDPRSASG